MKQSITLVCLLVLSLSFAVSAQNRTYTVEDLLKVRRVGDPQVSPDGRHVAFTIGDVNFDANRAVNQIYVVSIDGSGLKQLTSGDRSSAAPRWSPDGKKIAYTTGGQVWGVDADGDKKEQWTKNETGG